MNKDATALDVIEGFKRRFGSYEGAGAPTIFKGVGGPVTGSLVQGAAVALPAYLLRRGIGWWRYEDPEDSKRSARRMALLGALGGIGLNIPQFYQNAMDKDRGINWDPGDMQEPMEKTQGLQYSPYSYFPGIMNPVRSDENIPASYTKKEIYTDPFLSTSEKARALAIMDSTGSKSGLLSWDDVTRAAVGTGVGYVGGDLFGKTVSLLFGRVQPTTQRRLKQIGAAAGLLKSTGVI